MGKNPEERRSWESYDAYLERMFSQEPELVPGLKEENAGPGPRAKETRPAPAEPKPSETPTLVNGNKTTLVFGTKGQPSTEETIVIENRGSDTRISRRRVRPKHYPGDVPLDKVMSEVLYENLGMLHEELGDLMKDIIGDVFFAVVPEFEFNGLPCSGASYRTPPFRVIVKDKSLWTEPILNGSDEQPPEKIGDVVKTNPVTNEPFTRDEQMGLKNIAVYMETYGKGGVPDLPKRMYEPIEKSEHEDLRGYGGIQSIAYAIRKTAKKMFGEKLDEHVGEEFVCRVLEVEHKGKIYRVNGIRSPAFRLVKHEDLDSEEHIGMVPVNPEHHEGMSLGQVFTKNPETGEVITPNEYVKVCCYFKVKLELEPYSPPGGPDGRSYAPLQGKKSGDTRVTKRIRASFDYTPRNMRPA